MDYYWRYCASSRDATDNTGRPGLYGKRIFDLGIDLCSALFGFAIYRGWRY